MNEAMLLKRAKQGSRSALEWLIKLNTPKILGAIIAITRDEELSKDIFQETCIKVFHNIDKFKGDARFSTWAISIAKNIYIDNYRKEKRREATNLPPPVEPLAVEAQAELSEALSTFSPEDKKMILWKHHYGYTYEEIGKRLGIPAGTVRSKIHYALKRLKGGQ